MPGRHRTHAWTWVCGTAAVCIGCRTLWPQLVPPAPVPTTSRAVVTADSGAIFIRTLATHETKLVVLPAHGAPIAFYTDSARASALANAAVANDSAVFRDSSAGAQLFVLHRLGTGLTLAYRLDASQPHEVVSLTFTPRESERLLSALHGRRDAPDTTSMERDARTLQSTRSPRYPKALRSAHVEGVVIAEFVVDTTGRVDPRSVHIVQSTDTAFSTAVVQAVLAGQYAPATIAGQKVRQRVHQPFTFTIGH